MQRRHSHKAFTLIELLVVLGIIGILITLSITVGREVTRGGEDRITRDMIRVLDVTLTAWYSDKESKFPAFLDGDFEPAGLGGGAGADPQFPIIDGQNTDIAGSPVEPTLAAYLIIASETASVEKTLKQQIELKYLGASPLSWSFGQARYDGNFSGLTVLDAWGRPLRFVHPMWQGGYGDFYDNADAPQSVTRPTRNFYARGYPDLLKYSRSYRTSASGSGNADEGLCPGNRPYFYSAGRDKDPGTRDDNIYATLPSFPPETARFE